MICVTTICYGCPLFLLEALWISCFLAGMLKAGTIYWITHIHTLQKINKMTRSTDKENKSLWTIQFIIQLVPRTAQDSMLVALVAG